MISRDNTIAALQQFNKLVEEYARQNLQRLGKNTTGRLSDSISATFEAGPNSITNSISMEEYGLYQDQGVSGKKRKFNTPYSYTNKMPPASVFDKWRVKKGINVRGKGGRFTSRKSMNFAIARSVFNYGIKPSHFFTDAFDKAFIAFPEEIVEKYGLDVESFLRLTFQNSGDQASRIANQ